VLRLALGAQCAAQSAGIVIATEIARRHFQPAGERYLRPVFAAAF
jgi:hypothetical protein